MKNILVTGCNGQLGNEMQLLAAGHPEFNYFFTDVKELDITDEKAVKSFVGMHEIDCIVNCAAYTAVDKAESDEAFCDLLNHTAPGYLAKAVHEQGRLHDTGFYGLRVRRTAHIPYREEEPTCPATAYGRTKLAGEEAVMRNCPESVVIRTAWLYSTFGNNFVKTMLRLGREKRESRGHLRPNRHADLRTRPGGGHLCRTDTGFRSRNLPFQQRGSHLMVRLYQSHPPHSRYHHLQGTPAPYGRISRTGGTASLFRARQDQNQRDLSHRHSLLGRLADRVHPEIRTELNRRIETYE